MERVAEVEDAVSDECGMDGRQEYIGSIGDFFSL